MKTAMLLTAALAGATSFGAIRAVTPDMYGGNANAWQVKRHFEKMAYVTNGGAKNVWLDFNAKFLDEKGDTAKWMPDHCHPNAAGYKEIWLPSVLPYFKEIVGK